MICDVCLIFETILTKRRPTKADMTSAIIVAMLTCRESDPLETLEAVRACAEHGPLLEHEELVFIEEQVKAAGHGKAAR